MTNTVTWPEWTTEAQRESVMVLHKRDPYGWPLAALINELQPTIGCDGAVALPWAGMYVLIEKDGYRHT